MKKLVVRRNLFFSIYDGVAEFDPLWRDQMWKVWKMYKIAK